MKDWERFKTFKQRGEWVELRFMSEAALHGYHPLQPCGDSLEYDVGIEQDGNLLRVQVKSTTCRTKFGYLCQFKPNCHSRPYSVKELDFFAAYVIPEDVWYIIPASVLLRSRQYAVTMCPEKPRHPERYRYERYREAWDLLGKTRDELKHERGH